MKMPKLLKPAERTADTVAAEIAEQQLQRSAAQTELDRLQAGRPALLISGTDDDLLKNDETMRRLRSQIERADARLDALQREAAAMAHAGDQARRTAIYEAARAKANDAAAAITKAYPKIVREALAMLRTMAEAQVAVNEANAALPDGVVPIADPEMAARGTHGLPREIVSEEEVELWCLQDMTTPVLVEYQAEIHPVGNGWGKKISTPGANGSAALGDLGAPYRLRRFCKITYRDSTMAVHPFPLAAALQVPNVKGDRMAWGEDFPVFNPAITAVATGAANPQNVLTRLAEIEAEANKKPAPPKRPLLIEWECLGDVEPLAAEKPIPDTVSRRGQQQSAAVRFGSSPFAIPSAAGGRR